MSYKGRHNCLKKPQTEQAVWHFGNCNCFDSNYGNALEERFSLRFGWLCRYHWIDRACEFHPNVFIETSRLGETSGEEIKERNITIFGIFTASSECRVGQTLME